MSKYTTKKYINLTSAPADAKIITNAQNTGQIDMYAVQQAFPAVYSKEILRKSPAAAVCSLGALLLLNLNTSAYATARPGN